jgi:general secretion pathway protein B
MPTPAQPAPALRPPQAQAPSPAPAPAPAPIEEHVQSLHELPEPIQRAIPPIALGGYMYSKNPADRLLLIDKVLRREGEEVAPGLVLDKLLPKQAIFSFRGYRYRVPL